MLPNLDAGDGGVVGSPVGGGENGHWTVLIGDVDVLPVAQRGAASGGVGDFSGDK